MRRKFEIFFDSGSVLGVCILIYALITKKMEFGFFGVCLFFICELFSFIDHFIDRQESRDLKYEDEPKYTALDYGKLWEVVAYILVVVTLILSLHGKYYAKGINEYEKIILNVIALLSLIILLKIYYFKGFRLKIFKDGMIYPNGEWIPFEKIDDFKVKDRWITNRVTIDLKVGGYKGEFLSKNYRVNLSKDNLKEIEEYIKEGME